MKVLRNKWFPMLSFLLLLFFLITYLTVREQPFLANENCIKPFDEFAYLPDETPRPIPILLPDTPWEVETTIPRQQNMTYHVLDIQVELARNKNGNGEIWLFRGPLGSEDETTKREGSFLIYYPQSQRWEEISAIIEDTNLMVRELFVTSDETVWGKIGVHQSHLIPTTGPVLGRFNESERRFEKAIGGLEIPLTVNYGILSQLVEVVLDKQDVFWIFGPDNGIYHYDPRVQTTEKKVNLPYPEIQRLSTALAIDDSIYFQDKSLSEAEDFLFQFIPQTGEIITLDMPRKPWAASGGMLVDRQGRLRLGAMGYMETDGSWHLLHRNASKVWEYRGEPHWVQPTLVFESSDGLLWFTKYLDMGRLGEGTAWYNPETGQGCLFTNLASYIVEDDSRQLWMVADGKLYRYPLDD
jgi:hypothetical protein